MDDGAADGTVDYTVVFVAKFEDDDGFENLMGLNDLDSLMGTNNASPRKMTIFGGGGSVSTSTYDVLSSDGWCLFAYEYGNPGRYHKYVFDTDTWTHEDGTGAAPNNPTITDFWFGRTGDAQSFFNGSMLIAGWWDELLGDAAIEDLAVGTQAWIDAAATEAWRFNTMSAISSLTGSAGEVDRVGTSLDVGDAPAGWLDIESTTHEPVGHIQSLAWLG